MPTFSSSVSEKYKNGGKHSPSYTQSPSTSSTQNTAGLNEQTVQNYSEESLSVDQTKRKEEGTRRSFTDS